MKLLLIGGQFYTDLSSDIESDIEVPKRKETLAPALIDTVKALAGS